MVEGIAGEGICANCGAPLAGEYCSQCGQHKADVRVSVGVLAHDFLTEHVGLDKKIPRTLWRLVRLPGSLTTEYLAGRRVRYVPPLKLYLSASVVFFLLLAWLPSGAFSGANVSFTSEDKAQLDSIRADVAQKKSIPVQSDTLATAVKPVAAKSPTLMDKFLRRAAERFQGKNPQEVSAIVVAGFKKYLPNMIFAMLPDFAAILYLLYRRSRRFYAEHLIFAFNFHAFVFVAFTLMLFAPDLVAQIFMLWVFVYLFLAMRRVYGESRERTAVKFATTVASYIVCLFAASFIVLAGVVLVG